MTDRGLQPERTALAWQRTGLSAAVAAALLLRSGLLDGSAFALAAAGSALAAFVLAWLTGRRARTSGTPRWMLVAVTSTVCLTGVLTVLQLR